MAGKRKTNIVKKRQNVKKQRRVGVPTPTPEPPQPTQTTPPPPPNKPLLEYAFSLIVKQFGTKKRGVSTMPVKPTMHFIFGVPCSGKSRLSGHLVKISTNKLILNMDFDHVYTRHPELSKMHSLIDPSVQTEVGLTHGIRQGLVDAWYTLFRYAEPETLVSKCDIIYHYMDGSVPWDLGPIVLKALRVYNVQAHFVVAEPEAVASCLQNRRDKRRDVILDYAPDIVQSFNAMGSSFNVFLEEYEFMIRHTRDVFFFFPETGKHFHVSKVRPRVTTSGEIVVKPGKNRAKSTFK